MTTPPIDTGYDQVLYLLQGGGALGAYQTGVCETLLAKGLPPNWIIGTSIGGINGAILAGNKPEHRVAKLRQFWEAITAPLSEVFPNTSNKEVRAWENAYSSEWSLWFGVPGFFSPRHQLPFSASKTPPNELSFYDTSELRKTLETVIDFNILNSKQVRLTLGAVNVCSGDLEKFDNFKQELSADHIMASAALPPGFPAIKIDGKYYWDGGISSNTPMEVLLDENISQKLLCFMVNLFSYVEHEPNNMMDVFKRKKDLEFGSRHHMIIHYFCELQRFQQHIQTLYALIPDPEQYADIAKICKLRHPVAMNIVRFHYRDRDYDLWSKDFEFSARSLHERIALGVEDAKKAFKDQAWLQAIPSGVQVHNF